MAKDKFEVKIEYKVTETYEIVTHNADRARHVAEIGAYAPVGREVAGKNVVSVKKLGPRYITENLGPERFTIRDTVHDMVVATVRLEDVADIAAEALNKREEQR